MLWGPRACFNCIVPSFHEGVPVQNSRAAERKRRGADMQVQEQQGAHLWSTMPQWLDMHAEYPVAPEQTLDMCKGKNNPPGSVDIIAHTSDEKCEFVEVSIVSPVSTQIESCKERRAHGVRKFDSAN